MKTLAEWVRIQPFGRKDAVGWMVRIVKALLVLHELDAPHGRLNGHAIAAAGPACDSPGALLDNDEIPKDVQFYSVQRIKLSGASREDDVWALGVLFYFLLTGAYPFPGTHRRQIRERIEWRPASPLEVYGVEDPELQALLDRLFKLDEVLRLVSPKLLLRALLRLEPDADNLPELGVGVAAEDDEGSQTVDADDGDAIADPYTNVVESVHALLGSADGTSSPLTDGELPRGPMATLPQMALTASERQAIEEATGAKMPTSSVENRSVEPVAAAPAVEAPSVEEGMTEEATEPPATDAVAAGSDVPAQPSPRPSDALRERAASHPPKRRPRSGAKVAVGLWSLVALLAMVAVALYFVPGLRRSVVAMVTGRSAAVPTAKAPAFSTPSGPGVGTQPPSPVPRAVTASASSPAPGPVSPGMGVERDACVVDLFPADTFLGSRPRFDFVCGEEDPRKAADAMRVEVVLGKGTRAVTDAMKTWTELGWYQLAFVAVARTRCCGDDVPPLQSELGGPPCRFDYALADLGHAVVHGDDAHLDKAMSDYAGAINCLADAPIKDVYGFDHPAGGEEPAVFLRAVAPLRAARK